MLLKSCGRRGESVVELTSAVLSSSRWLQVYAPLKSTWELKRLVTSMARPWYSELPRGTYAVMLLVKPYCAMVLPIPGESRSLVNCVSVSGRLSSVACEGAVRYVGRECVGVTTAARLSCN